MKLLLVLSLVHGSLLGQAVSPKTAIPLGDSLQPVFQPTSGPCRLESEAAYSNFRLLLTYSATKESAPHLVFGDDHKFPLPIDGGGGVDMTYEHIKGHPARVQLWASGPKEPATITTDLPDTTIGGNNWIAPKDLSEETFRLDRDLTLMARFNTRGEGTIFAKTNRAGEWIPDAKALFIRGGRLVYDIGWLGAVRGKTKVDDGKEHVVVLILKEGGIELYLDGKLEARNADFSKPDPIDSVFKIGEAATDFGGPFTGTISAVHTWKRALSTREALQLTSGREKSVNTADHQWQPSEGNAEETTFGAIPGFPIRIKLVASKGFHLRSAQIQPLASSDHGEILRSTGPASFERGKTIYQQLCVTCHGTVKEPGSLPTAPRFHEAAFHNGSDPYSLFQTLEKGYGLMVAQPQYPTSAKYDVIHYLREEFLRKHNAAHYEILSEDYLGKLPRGMSLQPELKAQESPPPYLLQDFGNVLHWTLQVEEGNIAQKGIAIRLDPGPGGISQGRAWALYDHDTMRLAAIWTGSKFVDWKGIAFDGSHGTHTSILGKKQFVFPNEPMWADPETGAFEDTRIRGRDNKPYGPLPREWVHFKGLHIAGQEALLRYTVGDCTIQESIALGDTEDSYLRTFHCSATSKPLIIRLDASRTHKLPAAPEPFRFQILHSPAGTRVIEEPVTAPTPETPSSARFAGSITTQIQPGPNEGPFAVDQLTPPSPNRNPWQSWMRTSGFDFFPDGKSAAVCTWNGDVWIVDGIDQAEGALQWQRICAGLFQPLGLKIIDGSIHVGCRDMIARLVDLNGDRETDWIENFNNDHQVTEHFHEFAMGLQADPDGNFYYAKSARHAKTALVPHHGTLLRVSKDGSQTDILATGFRAANGVCLNPDGSFIVTDQEGHWNPKNRINWVKGTGPDDFYGNIYGYHGITDESDSAMAPPLCWITNKFDRSPSELLWVPETSAWKSLRGSLLNLSYGYGQIYVVPHESVNGTAQGGMCALPLNRFPTGIMRGRFHPEDGQLYGCGMFAWGGNQHQAGGFYRIRATGKPAYLPRTLKCSTETVLVGFSDPLLPSTAEDPRSWTVKAWNLKRSKSYGSKHYDEREWKVKSATVTPDGKSVTLTIPELSPTWGMSIRFNGKGANGEPVEREIHNTINQLPH